MSPWVRGMKWRVCIAKETTNRGRGPWENGGKGKQEQSDAREEKGGEMAAQSRHERDNWSENEFQTRRVEIQTIEREQQ